MGFENANSNVVHGISNYASLDGPLGLTAHELEEGSEPFKSSFPEKKIPSPDVSWRDLVGQVQGMQKLKAELSGSQSFASLNFEDATEPMIVAPFGDWHLGSFGTDYGLMIAFADYIKANNIKVIWMGDILQMSIALRGVEEVSDNALTPDLQMVALSSFLDELQPWSLAGTWDNHSVMREEKVTGYSRYAEEFKKRMVYFNGIGHLDLGVGNQTYKMALAHFFRGRSMYNPTHSQMRYMRMEANDREITIAADSHVPGFLKYKEGGMLRVAINSGTLQKDSGYGKRFFSLGENTDFPAIVLHNSSHQVSPTWTLGEAVALRNGYRK